jgi:hypothetical protein
MVTQERGPNAMARKIEAKIAELEGEKAAAPRADRRPINQNLHQLRNLLVQDAGWLSRGAAGLGRTPGQASLPTPRSELTTCSPKVGRGCWLLVPV